MDSLGAGCEDPVNTVRAPREAVSFAAERVPLGRGRWSLSIPQEPVIPYPGSP
jgi:hypothetical protein